MSLSPLTTACPQDSAAATRAIAARASALDPAIAHHGVLEGGPGQEGIRRRHLPVPAPPWWLPTVLRVRPGARVLLVPGKRLDRVSPGDFTIRTALRHLDSGDPRWETEMPAAQALPRRASLQKEHDIPGGRRVDAMHEGKRRACTRRR